MHTYAEIIDTAKTLSVPNSSCRKNVAKMGVGEGSKRMGGYKEWGVEKRMRGESGCKLWFLCNSETN